MHAEPGAYEDPSIELLPPLGAWVAGAACAVLVGAEAEAFTSSYPRPAEQESARAVCGRCLVRADCASYAETAPVYGMWGGRWYSGKEWRRALAVVRRDAKRAAREAA